jgi:hypothetical protein
VGEEDGSEKLDFLDSFRMGLVTRKAWIFQPHPSSREKKGTGASVNYGSHLHDEAFIKFPKVGGLESFQVGECIQCQEKACPISWKQKLLCWGCSQALSYVPLYLAVHLYPLSYPLLHNTPINIKNVLKGKKAVREGGRKLSGIR